MQTQWQYHIVNLIKSTGADSFEALGRAGWELVSVDNGKAYFKRPLVDEGGTAGEREHALAGESIAVGMMVVMIEGKWWRATAANSEDPRAAAPWAGAYAKNDAAIGEPVEITTGLDVEFVK